MPDVLFVCVHNSGRSQMAEAYFNHLATKRNSPLRAGSAGTMPGERVNPQATAAMLEIGVDLTSATPKQLTAELARESSRRVTMGCGVDVASCPAGTYFSEDWGLDDPAGKDIGEVRRIRNVIMDRVEALLNSMVTGG